MILYPLGIIIAGIAMFASVKHLGQDISSYYDVVALSVVLGGTFAVTVVTIPWEFSKDIFKGIGFLLGKRNSSMKTVVADCINFIQQASQGVYNSPKSTRLYHKILSDGFELTGLGLSSDRIEQILIERVQNYSKRQKKVANALRSLAKYPPAFGLMGTVLGLVNVMQGVSHGVDGKETALKMAIALVATMYGLIVSNLIINPAGEMILKRANEEESQGEIAINATLLLKERASLLESQELLNSFVSDEHRVNILDGYNEAA